MSAKKKLIIVISACMVAILAAVGVLVAVLASKNVTIQSGVNVKYTVSSNVKGVVTASYQTKNGSPVSLGSKEYFGTENGTGADSLRSMEDLVTLTTNDNQIVFTFTFTNTNTEKAYTATLINEPTNSNFRVDYSCPMDGGATATSATAKTFKLDPNTTTAVKYTVTYTIDSSKDCSLTDNFVWQIVSE